MIATNYYNISITVPVARNRCSLSAILSGLARRLRCLFVFCVAELSLMMAQLLSSRPAYCKASLTELLTDELITPMPFEPPLLYSRGSLIHSSIKHTGEKKGEREKMKKSFTPMSFQYTKVTVGADAGYSSAQGSKGLWRLIATVQAAVISMGCSQRQHHFWGHVQHQAAKPRFFLCSL